MPGYIGPRRPSNANNSKRTQLVRWLGLQTPVGQAAAIRFIAALTLQTLGSKSVAVRVTAAVTMIGSFLLEGHTASAEWRSALSTTALLLHLAAIHWWLGSLYPLLAMTRRGDPRTLVSAVEAFSSRAVWIVATLVAAGAVLLGHLTGWTLRIDSAYQLRFLFKLGLVILLLSIASWNKFRLTPLLRRDPAAGAAALSGVDQSGNGRCPVHSRRDGVGHQHRTRRVTDDSKSRLAETRRDADGFDATRRTSPRKVVVSVVGPSPTSPLCQLHAHKRTSRFLRRSHRQQPKVLGVGTRAGP